MKENISKEDLLLMVKRLDLSLDAHLNRVMGGQDLSGGQAAVLCYLLRHHPEGSCIRDLCLELGVSHATLSLMIKKLQEKGYLSVQADAADRRKRKLTATEKLLREAGGFLKRSDQAESQICKALDSRERQELYRLQKKMLQGIREQKKT